MSSATPVADRSYDVVVFGATGFTGALTAEYLARHAPADTRWALAGRNAGKLEEVRRRLTAVNARCAELPLLRADTTDPGDQELAEGIDRPEEALDIGEVLPVGRQ